MYKVSTKIKKIEKKWKKVITPDFLNINFLKIYYQNHKKIKHLFIVNDNLKLYAHIFKLTLNKTKNYLDNKLLPTTFLSFVSLKVLYLTNSYITNTPFFISNKKINEKELLNNINEHYSIIIIPDFLFKNMIIEDNNYIKIEAEEEMILNIRKEWLELNDYILDLKKKYRSKVKQIINKTNNLEIRNLNPKDLTLYAKEIQKLFNQVATASRFQGPLFNTDSFIEFTQQKYMKVDGLFLHNKLVGFSSIIDSEDVLYSYFVGFDKKLNKLTPLYGRILIENINTAIMLKKKNLILGRTANEYKSNFGATPIKSFIYLKVKNKFLRVILKPIYSKLRINKWIQRKPFKNK